MANQGMYRTCARERRTPVMRDVGRLYEPANHLMRYGPQPPKILCKYFSPGGVRALDSMTFRFTPPKDLNDPFEGVAPTVLRAARDSLSFGVSKHGRLGVLSPPQ